MLAVTGKEIKTLEMDHHGLFVGVCKDLNIAGLIDSKLTIDPRIRRVLANLRKKIILLMGRILSRSTD